MQDGGTRNNVKENRFCIIHQSTDEELVAPGDAGSEELKIS